MAQTKVRIFIDFWNFQLAWKAFHNVPAGGAPVKLPWEEALSKSLVSKVAPEMVSTSEHMSTPLSIPTIRMTKS